MLSARSEFADDVCPSCLDHRVDGGPLLTALHRTPRIVPFTRSGTLSEFLADSGPSRTVIPTHRGQRSGDRGQLPMSV
jgi:hypothetical protein